MMVKSISQSSRGQYNLKKKKVWIKLNDEKEESEVEYETEIIDLSDFFIYFYDKNGKLVLHKKEKYQLNILV